MVPNPHGAETMTGTTTTAPAGTTRARNAAPFSPIACAKSASPSASRFTTANVPAFTSASRLAWRPSILNSPIRRPASSAQMARRLQRRDLRGQGCAQQGLRAEGHGPGDACRTGAPAQNAKGQARQDRRGDHRGADRVDEDPGAQGRRRATAPDRELGKCGEPSGSLRQPSAWQETRQRGHQGIAHT